MSNEAERLAQKVLKYLDDLGAGLSVKDWIELCDEVAYGAKTRSQAAESDK